MSSLDFQIAALVDEVAQLGLPPLHSQSLTQLRARGDRSDSVDPTWWGDVASTKEILVPGADGLLAARLYKPHLPPGAVPPIVLFFHGGGWATGNLDTHDGQVRLLAAESHAIIVSVAYRLAPENPFPAAVDDAQAVTSWLVSNAHQLGGDPTRVAVGGDSAGANLAAVVAQSTAGRNLIAQLLVYPALAGSSSSSFDSYKENENAPLLDKASLERFLAWYGGACPRSNDPRFAPLFAGCLAETPAAVIAVAGLDPLRDEGIAYANRLRAAGVAVSLYRYDTLVHAFMALAPISSAAENAAREVAREFGAVLARSK